MIEVGQIHLLDLPIIYLIAIVHTVVIMVLHTQCGMALNTFIGRPQVAERLLTMTFKREDRRLVVIKGAYYEY
jgi:hypothetical protein